MRPPNPSYDLNELIQRLKSVRNREIIRQFHALLDLLDQSSGADSISQNPDPQALDARIDAAEQSIVDGTTMPQDEFQKEVQAWIGRKKA